MHTLILEAQSSPENSAWTFPLLAESVQQSSDAELKDNCSKWTGSLVQCLQVRSQSLVRGNGLRSHSNVFIQACKCVSVIQDICGALSSLLDRVKKSQSVVRDFTSIHLPTLMQGLLWFQGADPQLQCSTMRVAVRCLVHFTTATLQFKNQLRKWAQGGLFSEQLQLSQVICSMHYIISISAICSVCVCVCPFIQECSRLLVLLCLNSCLQWTTLVQNLTTALQWTLTSIHQPGLCVCVCVCVFAPFNPIIIHFSTWQPPYTLCIIIN